MAVPYTATANTKLLWHLNGDSTDSSGNANNGTDNSVDYGAAYGIMGQGALFNAAGDYIKKETNLGIAGAETMTVSIFFKPTTDIGADTWNLWTHRSTLTNTLMIQLNYEYNAGTRRLAVYESVTANATLGTSWHNIIITRAAGSGGNVMIYLDGVWLATAAARTATNIPENRFYLGGSDAAAGIGSYDEVIVENRVWTAAEILAYYNASAGGSQAVWMFMRQAFEKKNCLWQPKGMTI